MRTFLLTLALVFAVIGGAVAVSTLADSPAHAGECTNQSC